MHKDVQQEVDFLFAINSKDLLPDFFDGDFVLLEHECLWFVHVSGCEFLDFFWHGCGKEHGLANSWYGAHDFFDVVDESHVEHAVCFVKDCVAYKSKVDGSAFHVVDDSARCCDCDLCSAIKCIDLWSDANSAVEEHAFDSAVYFVDFGVDLDGEFARRSEYDCLEVFVGCDVVENGQKECECFSAAGFAANNQIFSGKKDRNGFFLDFGCVFKFERGKGANKFWLDV